MVAASETFHSRWITSYSSVTSTSGGRVCCQEGVDLSGWVAVQHEDLAKVSFGCPQEIEAVGLGLAEGLLMPEDNLCVVVLELCRRR